MKWVAISDIIIPDVFANTKPRQYKIDKIRNYYLEYGCVDKPVTVNGNNVLIDGYIRYLVLKENGAMYAKAEVRNFIHRRKKVEL